MNKLYHVAHNRYFSFRCGCQSGRRRIRRRKSYSSSEDRRHSRRRGPPSGTSFAQKKSRFTHVADDFFTPGRPSSASKEPKVIYFWRHGQSEGNKHSSDPLDTLLTPLGIRQAAAWSKLVQNPDSKCGIGKIDAVLCSPLRRTMHTAALAFGEKHVPKVCTRESDGGTTSSAEDVRRTSAARSSRRCRVKSMASMIWTAQRTNFGIQEEERHLGQSELGRRSTTGLLRLLKAIEEQDGERVAVVTHSGVIEHLLGAATCNADIVVAMLENGVLENLHHLKVPLPEHLHSSG